MVSGRCLKQLPWIASLIGVMIAWLLAASSLHGQVARLQVQDEEPLPRPRPLETKAAVEATPFISPVPFYPIDLATALRLAGANNLQIALATERVRQAQARLQGANALWLPNIDAGVGYNRHQGQIQDTRGEILDVRRSSLFVGGGPNVGPASLNGGNNGPARLFLGLSLADAIFAPLAERQIVQGANAAQAATFNDTLLAVCLSYLDLIRAQGEIVIAREAADNARELLRLVESRVKAGTAPPADGLRVEAELAERQRQVAKAEERVFSISAELVRLLRLDPTTVLFSQDAQPVAINIFGPDTAMGPLIAQGLANRPELAEHRALVNATLERLRQEHWRPFIPNLQVGFGAGGFGGGRDGFFGDFRNRTDFDALAVWEMRNLGLGNRALKNERNSQNLQANLAAQQMQDIIAAEVSRAYYRIQTRRQQIEAAQAQVKAAAEAMPLNFKGIVGGVLRAIEAQQAIQALAAARNQYLTSLTDFNQAQFELLRALGQPPDADRK